MAEAQQSRALPVPPSGAKKSPLGAGQAKGDVARSPTMPNFGAAKKAPLPPPRKPAEDADSQQPTGTIAATAPKLASGPPKLPPRGNTVAQLGGRSPPVASQTPQPGHVKVAAEPSGDPAEPSLEAAHVDQNIEVMQSTSTAQVEDSTPPSSADFEPPKTVKPAPSFRDTIAIPNSAILSHQPSSNNINNANGASPAAPPEPGQGLTTALADPLFRKIEVTLSQKRDNIANELLTTEQSYLKSLTIVNELYRKPMIDAVKSGQLAITEDIVTDIFSRNFPDILRVNFTLLSGLVERLSSWSAEQTPFLKMYTQYTANYERSNQLLDEYESKEPMSSFLAKCNENPVRAGLGLKAFLIMPIQRIPRYRLLLEDLVKNTPEAHPDHKNLNLALEKLKIVAEQVDKAIYEQKNRELMLKIQKRVGDAIQIIEPGRIFVREGELTKVCRKDTKKRFFVLFSDMVLYATELPTGRLMNVNVLKMTSLGVRDLPDDPKRNQANALQISSEKKSFVVMAASAADKSAWIAEFNKALDKFEESGKTVKNDSRQRRVSNLAPVWVPDSEARTCTICGIKFTLTNRRHHCRQCGNVVCGKCSSKKKDLPGQGKQRVCDICFDKPYDAASSRGGSHAPSADDGLNSDSDDEDALPNEVQNPQDNQPVGFPVAASPPSAGSVTDFCEAAFDYEPPAGNPAPKKLPFKAGDMLKILQRDNSGWWLAELSGQKGWVPAAFLKVQN